MLLPPAMPVEMVERVARQCRRRPVDERAPGLLTLFRSDVPAPVQGDAPRAPTKAY
jgi:hypothetical protein